MDVEFKDLPSEIQTLMLMRQEEQGNEVDASVFDGCIYSDRGSGGFTWEETPEGHPFWESIIEFQNYYNFYEKYDTDGFIELEI